MIKKNENNNNAAGSAPTPAPKERPRIKPPEIRPRAPMPTNNRPAAPAHTPRPAQRPLQRPGARPGQSPVRPQPRPQHGGGGTGGSGSREEREARREYKHGPGAPRATGTNVQHSKMGPRPQVAHDPNEKPNPDAVRLLPLGGLEEIGRNCSFLEYKNEIVIIDMGLQFP